MGGALNDPKTPADAAGHRRHAGDGRRAPEVRYPGSTEGFDLGTLIAELSARFPRLASVEVDREIEDAQRRLCESIGMDVSVLYQWMVGAPGILTMTHLYHPKGSQLPPAPMDAREFFPWTLQRVMSGKTTVVPSVEGLPPEVTRDRESWCELGVKSALVIPLSSWGNPLVGVLTFGTLTQESLWPQPLVDQLQRFARIIADVLARKATDTALGESEARLASAVDIAELGFYESAEEGRVTFLDWRLRELFGIPLGEDHRTREYWVARLHPDDRDGVLEASRKLLSGDVDRAARQYRYLHPERGLLWIHHVARVVTRDAAGKQTRQFGVVQDITQRKRIEISLRDLAERYATITSTTTDGFWEVDEEGRIVAANEEACRMSGYTRDELLTMSVGDLDHSQSTAEIRQLIQAIRGRGLSRFETRHRCKDGRLLEIEVSTTYCQSSGTLLAFIRDVTARTRDAERLRESLEFNRIILTSLVDSIVILGRDGEILAINDAWERFALAHGGPGALASTGVGVNYLEVCRRANAREVLEGIESVLSGGCDLFRHEYTAHTPMEFRWYLMEVMPLQRTEGGAVVVHRDITERKKTEEELRRLRTDIWHAHRVAQTGAIAASLAHELNQPLAAILHNAQAGARMMAVPNPDLDEIREILADIVHDDKRAASVIVGLRAMLRRKETEHEKIDLGTTIREVLDLLRGELLAHDVEVDLQASSDYPLLADRAQIQQVVFNLVTNAIEAMEGQPAEQRRLEVSLTSPAAGSVQLAVRDRGRGIPASAQQHVFDAFWSTKSNGMGLGLPICRSIIESHGGHLWCANNESHGVTFFVSLPIHISRDVAGGAEGKRSS